MSTEPNPSPYTLFYKYGKEYLFITPPPAEVLNRKGTTTNPPFPTIFNVLQK